MNVARLTTTDVAHQLRVSPKQVREYVYQGRLSARCEGRRLYFLPGDVAAFCASMPVYDTGLALPNPKVETFRRYRRTSA